jgi:hypothetical protein
MTVSKQLWSELLVALGGSEGFLTRDLSERQVLIEILNTFGGSYSKKTIGGRENILAAIVVAAGGSASPRRSQNELLAALITAIGGSPPSYLSSSKSELLAAAVNAATVTDEPVLFRSLSNTPRATSTNTTITAPAGIVDGDILILTMWLGGPDAPPTPTFPSGFTEIDFTSVTDGSYNGNMHVAWKRAAGESGDYTVTHESASAQGFMAAYSGCVATGSPIDAYSKNTGADVTSTATGVTTSAANTRLLYLAHDWQGTGTLTPPTGMTERHDDTDLIYLADEAVAAVGATGNRTQTNGNTGDNPWAAFLIALKT